MRCPTCAHIGTKVLDSRSADEGRATRRRRECESCHYRFTTFERIEESPLVVVKKDGTREVFDKDKILRGLIKACEKRPVTLAQLEEITEKIEREARNQGFSEVNSEHIGGMVMEHLAKVDDVAYVRFASVYRQFKDLNVFINELKELLGKDNT